MLRWARIGRWPIGNAGQLLLAVRSLATDSLDGAIGQFDGARVPRGAVLTGGERLLGRPPGPASWLRGRRGEHPGNEQGNGGSDSKVHFVAPFESSTAGDAISLH